MTKVPDLPELDALANEDKFYVVDVSDLTDSADGSSKFVTGGKVGGVPGNVLRFGADPSGDTDSSAAIQAAVDSGHAVYVPPGKYRLDSTVVILDPLIMYCFGGQAVNDGGGGTGEDRPDIADLDATTQATFFTTGTNHLFQIQTGNVSIKGGFYTLAYVVPNPSPSSPLVLQDQACFHFPFIANGSGAGGNADRGGWGVWIEKVWVAGAEDQLQSAEDQGGIGFWFDSENYAVSGAYWTNIYLQGEASGLKYVVYAPPRRTDVYQWNNNAHWRFGVQTCKTAIMNASFKSCTIWCKHQGRHMFSTEAEANRYASLYLRGGNHVIEHHEVFDFGKGPTGGIWTNQVGTDIVGPDVRVVHDDEFDSGGIEIGSRTHWEKLVNARGIFPRYLARQDRRGMFIPELHDQLLYNALRGTVTLKAYRGDDVIASPTSPPDIETAFDAIPYDSGEFGITASSDITITGEDELFLYEGVISGGVGMAWNQAAIDRMDYTELHLSLVNTALATLWVDMSCGDGRRVKYIQVARYSDSSPQSPAFAETVWKEVEPMGENRNKRRLFEFELSGGGGTDILVRFIGSNELGNSPESVSHSFVIFGAEEFSRQPAPILTVHGGKRVYGHLLFDEGGVGDRQVTTAELEDITHEVNTSAYKREGFCVYNTTTNKPVWATGDGDGDNWLDATGAVAHTPV